MQSIFLLNMAIDIVKILHRHDLRSTTARRLVLKVLVDGKKPLTHKQILQRTKEEYDSINLVSIYRIIQKFEELGIVHSHSRSGGFTLCSLIGDSGHHVLLSCEQCGKVEECMDKELCKKENEIAKENGFSPTSHLNEIIGVCESCQLCNT